MNDWILEYQEWNRDQHPLIEALCTLGNGYFATRGALELEEANEYNYPGTYLAGGYNRSISEVHGRTVENEDLVNWPNWLQLSFKIEDSDWLELNKAEILDYVVSLNIKQGVLERKISIRDCKNRETTIISRRIVSMHEHHVAGIEWTLIPQNWEGELKIRSGINGDVTNSGVKRYRDLNGNHLEIIDKGYFNKNYIYLKSRTKKSEIVMTQTAVTRIFRHEDEIDEERVNHITDKSIWQEIKVTSTKLHPIRIEKLVTLYTSRDFAVSDSLTEAKYRIQHLGTFQHNLQLHIEAWFYIWKRCNIELKTNNSDILMLRLFIFHLYQTVSPFTIGQDVGVPARGLHGEAYRGHIFWDELYIFPFINLHMPQLARSLLMYRYRRLPKAREEALKNGYRGAMFPWQSGSDGREESQVIHLNPKSGRWVPDNTWLQRHINAAIPYNVWQYYQITEDMDFLCRYGADIIFSTALFWSSIAEFNPHRNRYEIRGIVGPDEYHTSYPGSEIPGLNNNAYTNLMAVWVMQCALNLLQIMGEECIAEISDKTGFTDEDVEMWRQITHKMYIPFNDEGVIMQFEGFEKLKELDWKKYREKYGEVMRLDRILESENDSPDNYRICKQADVLMLFYLFSKQELAELCEMLGYEFNEGCIQKNIEYYQNITSNGSSLSQVVNSWVLARSDRERSWESYKNALLSDVKDVQGGTTPEGIHLGAMAGTVDILQRCYTGLEFREDVLWLDPLLPEEIKEITLHIRYRSHWIKLQINHKKLRIDFDKGWANPVEINVRGKKKYFNVNDSAEFEL